jgi:hypothetical protein
MPSEIIKQAHASADLSTDGTLRMADQLLARYLRGESAAVWRDLAALGTAARMELYYTDAVAVASETMKRARHNVELIVPRLETLGYEFNGYSPVFAPSGESAARDLDEFERGIGGPLPLSLRYWYQHVGSVNWMGWHEALNPKKGCCGDPLVVGPYRQAAEEAAQALGQGPDNELPGEFPLWLAPDPLGKSNTSGGSPYAMKVPDPSADAPLLYEWSSDTLVSYLRRSFKWGGFADWSGNPAYPKKEIDYLTEGLLAI